MRKADGHLLGQKGNEEDPNRAVQDHRLLGVDDEQSDGKHDAGDDQRREREKREIPRSAQDIAIRDVGDQHRQESPRGRG